MKEIKVGFLGLGNIGGGVYRTLDNNRADIIHKEGVSFKVKRALVRNLDKARTADVPEGVLTTRFEDILEDDEITLVAEFMGAPHPACEYLTQLLRAGKTVVTANKEVIAHCWPELEEAAKEGGAGLYYEAAVAGGIPVIRAITDSMQANNVRQIMGIVNGTTNYILTRMAEDGMEYSDALAEAQQKGLAEPDPTNDVEGKDAACKLSILASLGFHARVPLGKIYCEGITKVAQEDIELGKEMGYALKLLAIGKKDKDNRIEVRVHPTFISEKHPLSSVQDSYNAIFLTGDAVGNLMFYGRGAGDLPTASAIISDMVYAAKTDKHRYNTFKNVEDVEGIVEFNDDWQSKYFLHLSVEDAPGVLAVIATIFAGSGISIESVVQKGHSQGAVPLILITHMVGERMMKNAIRSIEALPQVKKVNILIRVEEDYD